MDANPDVWFFSLDIDFVCDDGVVEPDLDERDPRWIGAWWLGFVICGAVTCLWAVPVVLFPRKLVGTEPDINAKDQTQTENKDGGNIIDLLRGQTNA